MRALKLFFLSIAIALSSIYSVQAQIKNSSLRGFPVAFYTEETSFAFGGLGILTFDFESNLNSLKPSQINFGAAYTLENQLLIYFPYELYLYDNDWRFEGEVGYYRYTYKYYGIGNDTPESNEETYSVNFPRVQVSALTRVSDEIYAGLSYWYDGYNITDIKQGGLLDIGSTTGKFGGTLSGLGFISIYDTRDNIFSTKEGEYAEVRAEIDRTYLGSDYNFYRLTLEVSSFRTNSLNHTLAVNLYGESLGGRVPFQRLGLLGGSKRMRGYLEGRYRDNLYLTAQAEYRVPIYKRFGLVGFASIGDVAPNFYTFYTDSELKWTVGPGLRYMIDTERKVNIRLDAGFGKGVSGFALTIGEAF